MSNEAVYRTALATPGLLKNLKLLRMAVIDWNMQELVGHCGKKILVLISASVDRFGVSRIRDFKDL